MTGWELRIWRKSMLWSREKAAREFGVTQRTWHAWENAEQVDVTVWRTTQALSVRDLLPHMQGMRKADIIRRLENERKRAARTVLTGMCYSVGSATRQGSSSPTRFIGQSAMTSRT